MSHRKQVVERFDSGCEDAKTKASLPSEEVITTLSVVGKCHDKKDQAMTAGRMRFALGSPLHTPSSHKGGGLFAREMASCLSKRVLRIPPM
jgi:hypothetical protein